jgi:hypothetical protein
VGDLKTVISVAPFSAGGGVVAGPAQAARNSNTIMLNEKNRFIIFSPDIMILFGV